MKTFSDGVLWAVEGFALFAAGRVLWDWFWAWRRREAVARAQRVAAEARRENERWEYWLTAMRDADRRADEIVSREFLGGKGMSGSRAMDGASGGLARGPLAAAPACLPGEQCSEEDGAPRGELGGRNAAATEICDGGMHQEGARLRTDDGTMVGDAPGLGHSEAGPGGSAAMHGRDGKVSPVPAVRAGDQRSADADDGGARCGETGCAPASLETRPTLLARFGVAHADGEGRAG